MQIPIFPLPLVLFPGEKLNLHIFEPRYKQMIAYCREHDKPFGIIPVIGGRLMEVGTFAGIHNIFKTYSDGRMDIVVVGKDRFKVLNTSTYLDGFLFGGANIEMLEEDDPGVSESLQKELCACVKELYNISGVQKPIPDDCDQFQMEDFIHYLGLGLDQEYQIFSVNSNGGRYSAVIKYIEGILPALHAAKAMRERISMNGHFQELKSPPWK